MASVALTCSVIIRAKGSSLAIASVIQFYVLD